MKNQFIPISRYDESKGNQELLEITLKGRRYLSDHTGLSEAYYGGFSDYERIQTYRIITDLRNNGELVGCICEEVPQIERKEIIRPYMESLKKKSLN